MPDDYSSTTTSLVQLGAMLSVRVFVVFQSINMPIKKKINIYLGFRQFSLHLRTQF